MQRTISTAAVLLLVLGNVGAQQLSCPFNFFGPCHPPELRVASTCQAVRIPFGLCGRCTLKAPNPNGTFVDAREIYNIDKPECKTRLRRYARQNPCDSGRISLQSLKKAANGNTKERLKIDYMLYAVCEQCCDCIPKGTKKSETGATTLKRGNCPAHAHFDICKIHPKIKWMAKGKKSKIPSLKKLPSACQELENWSNGPNFKGWPQSHNIVINQKIKNFLDNVLDATTCTRKSIWNPCFDLEKAQDRVR